MKACVRDYVQLKHYKAMILIGLMKRIKIFFSASHFN